MLVQHAGDILSVANVDWDNNVSSAKCIFSGDIISVAVVYCSVKCIFSGELSCKNNSMHNCVQVYPSHVMSASALSTLHSGMVRIIIQSVINETAVTRE